MHLVQLLVPAYDRGGARFPQGHYDALVRELTERFGGLTAYVRAPAAGFESILGQSESFGGSWRAGPEPSSVK